MIDYRDTCWFNVQGDMICVPTLHAYLPNTQKNDEFDLDLHQTNPSHLDLDLHHLHPSSLLPQPPWPATPLKSTPCWAWMGKPRQWSLHVRVGGRWEMTTMFACGWWFWFCHSRMKYKLIDTPGLGELYMVTQLAWERCHFYLNAGLVILILIWFFKCSFLSQTPMVYMGYMSLLLGKKVLFFLWCLSCIVNTEMGLLVFVCDLYCSDWWRVGWY